MTESLKVGKLFTNSFSLFAKFFLPMIIIVIVPILMIVFRYYGGTVSPIVHLFRLAAEIVIYSIITLIAFDASQGRSTRFIFYINHIIRRFLVFLAAYVILTLPSIILSASILLYSKIDSNNTLFNLFIQLPAYFKNLTFITLFFLTFILAAKYYIVTALLVAPVALLEQRGLSTVWRSWKLAQGYRWSAIGLIFLIIISILIPLFTFAIIVVHQVAAEAGPLANAIIQELLYEPITAIIAVATVLLYLRLREIKEGVTAEQITLD